MRFLLALGLLPILCLIASADTISPVYVSIGPVPGTASPSVSSYYQNASTGVQNGGATTGAAGPTQFSTVSSVTYASLLQDTDFNSWQGVANPAAPYNNEFGNAAFFSVVLEAPTGQNTLALNDISFTQSSSDPFDYFGGTGSYAGSNYTDHAIGILANGTTVAPGTSGTTDVNEIILVGVGLAVDITGSFAGTPQQQLDEAVADRNTALGNNTITTCFSDSADGLSNCGSLNVLATVPEPSSFGLLALALICALPLGCRRLATRRA